MHVKEANLLLTKVLELFEKGIRNQVWVVLTPNQWISEDIMLQFQGLPFTRIQPEKGTVYIEPHIVFRFCTRLEQFLSLNLTGAMIVGRHSRKTTQQLFQRIGRRPENKGLRPIITVMRCDKLIY